MLYIPLTSEHILRGNKINMLMRHLYSYVYCSIIHKNEGIESNKVHTGTRSHLVN